jgi:CheY-like chemotaxis protein
LSSPSSVFVLDSNPAVVEQLCRALAHEGFRTAGVSADDVRLNQAKFEALVRAHEPAAILFDIRRGAPAEWAFLAHVRRTEPCRDIPLVLTTDETRPVKDLLHFHLSETIYKPYSVPAIVGAIRRAVSLKRDVLD